MSGDRVTVLAFGRVERAPFAAQLEHLAREHAPLSAGALLDRTEGGPALPARALLLTFDEPASFAAEAWPLLRRHGLAAVVFVPAGAELEPAWRALAEQGVALGLRGTGRTSAAELRAFQVHLERAQPGAPRLLAYGPAQPGADEVAAARAARVELAFTEVPGATDLRGTDPLRLPRLAVGPRDSAAELAARLESARLLCDEGGERARRAAHRRRRVRRRAEDAALTAALRPRPAGDALRALFWPRSSNHERVRNAVSLAAAPLPALARGVRRALLDASRLPFLPGLPGLPGATGTRAGELELLGHGSAATVFGLEARGGWALKVYRSTLGAPGALLLQMARRHRARHGFLAAWFGECVLPAHFLVLHAPLRGLAVAACLQRRVEGAHDLLALSDAELLAYLRARPRLGAAFGRFARRTLELRARGFFPDVLGPGNLLALDPDGRAELVLIDYGLFDLRTRGHHPPAARLEACVRRFEGLAAQLAGAGP